MTTPQHSPHYDDQLQPPALTDLDQRLGWTGIVCGATFTDKDGKHWQQVAEYEHGECVDRYVSRAPAPGTTALRDLEKTLAAARRAAMLDYYAVDAARRATLASGAE